MRRAAIYARQSRTTEGSASLAIQVDACRQTADRFDVEVVHELCERPSTSGYKNRGRDRPQFLQLLELIRAGEVDCVIVYKTDRLSRGGGVGYAPLLEAIEVAGHNANRFVLQPDGWLSELEMGIRAAIDREESEKISSRMLDVRAREAREGKPRVGNCRPYGYEYDKSTKELRIVVAEAETVRECAQRVLAGESCYSVVRDLNRRGIASPTGRMWCTKVLQDILRSARIAGLRSHLGEVVAQGQWAAIITEDEHHRLVAVTANRHSHGPKKAARTFPLVGFLTCGRCSRPLRSMVSTSKERRRRRYVCRSGDALDGCGGIQIKAEFVEDAVRDYIAGVICDPAIRDALLAAAPSAGNQEQESVLADLRQVDLARQRLTDLAVDGVITPAEVRRKIAELNNCATALESRLADAAALSVLARLPLTPSEFTEAWDERGIDYQRSLITLLINTITVRAATRMRPGAFDQDRLIWDLRV